MPAIFIQINYGKQLLGVHGLATQAGAFSHLFIRTSQHTGHPHPVLVQPTSDVTKLINIML